MKSTKRRRALLLLAGIILASGLLYRIPAINSRLAWRIDVANAYIRGVIDPVGEAPTPIVRLTEIPSPTPSATPMPTRSPEKADSVDPVIEPTPTALPTETPTPSPTLPAVVSLPAPTWEKQGWNNCGPATLALYLQSYGWEGDQYDISAVVKPQLSDRNVNVEELIYYVWNHVAGFGADFRVGGDIDRLQRFLAAGIPIMIEEGMILDSSAWPNDDRWAGHYLLLTGYDAENEIFIGQDSYYGADQQISFETLDANWKAFNRVFIFVYPSDLESMVEALLGPHEDYEYNRQHALEISEAEIDADPDDAFAWFNLGSNLVYFKRYLEAAQVYDTVRQLGVPQRMWRYQFSPFLAYFHSERTDDLMAVTEYALQITEQSEEALLWRGWGRVRKGETDGAIADFRAALAVNANYQDALYALDYLGASP